MQKYTVKYRGNPKLYANLAKLETVQPRLVKRLRAFIKKGGSGFQWTVEQTASGSWIHGLTEEPFFEHADAPYTAEIRHKGYPIAYLMGRGSRHYLKQAMNAAPADTKYYVFVETRLEPVIDTLCALDLEDPYFERKAVLFLIDDDRDGSHGDMHEFYYHRGTYIGALFNIMRHRALCERNSEKYRTLVKSVSDAVGLQTMMLGNSGEDTMWGFRQSVLNAAWMIEGTKLQSLQELLYGRPLVIVAAGPSLDKNLHLLKGMEDRVLIVSVETVLRKLLRLGIPPHFVVSLERGFEVYDKHLVDVVDHYRDELRDVVMVSQAVCVNLVAGRWPGPVAIVGKKGLLADHRFLTETMNVPRMESGASAAHMGLGLAELFRSSSVALIGQDLAYADDGRSHVSDTAWESEGVDIENKERFDVPGWDGGTVRTNRAWKFFIDCYNEIIPRTGLNVHDCTEGGALIERAPKSTFADWLKRFAATNTLSGSHRLIGEALRRREHNVSPAQAAERIRRFKELFAESSRQIALGLDALSRVEEGASKEANLKHVEEMEQALNAAHVGNELLQVVGQGPSSMLRSEWHVVRDMENPDDLRAWKETHEDFFRSQRIACNFHAYWIEYMLRSLEMMEEGILPGLGNTGMLDPDAGLPLIERIISEKDRYDSEMEWDIRLDNAYARCAKLSSSWSPHTFRRFAAHFQNSGRIIEAQALMTLAVRFTEGKHVSGEEAFELLRDWSYILSCAELSLDPYIKKSYEALKDAREYAPDAASLRDLAARLLRIRENGLKTAREQSYYPSDHILMKELASWMDDIEMLRERLEEGEDILRTRTSLLDKVFGIAPSVVTEHFAEALKSAAGTAEKREEEVVDGEFTILEALRR